MENGGGRAVALDEVAMINFVCACGRAFSFPDDTAGETFQCPDCLRALDVPTLSDLASMEADGTIKVAEALARRPEAELDPDYIPRLKEQVGDVDEYDLRPTADDIIKAGVEAVPLKEEDEVRPATPKYDPETGELIRPMAVKQDKTPVAAVAAAVPVISYATAGYGGGVPPWRVPLELLMPANITVIVVMFMMHMLNQVVALMTAGGFFLIAPVGVVIAFFVLAHYVNVIDEVGRAERDELPTPLRGLSWSEDIWHPFVGFAAALMLCYFPAVWAADASVWVAGALALLGSVFFPAVLLTTATSGSMWNLRPDRVLSVMGICGGKYILMGLLWLVAGGVYTAAAFGVIVHAVSLVSSGGLARHIAVILAYPVLLGAIYLMHLFAWYEGLLYRAHNVGFPWVLQRHIPTVSEDEKKLRQHRLEQLRKQKARQAADAAVERIPLEP
jgi:hypothetical protein